MSTSSDRDRIHNKDKPYAVTFFDFSQLADQLLHYTSKILEPPFSNPVQLVDTRYENDDLDLPMSWRLIPGTGRKHSDYLGIGTAGSDFDFKRVLGNSRAAVLNDPSLFYEHRNEFKAFFDRGGKVVIIGRGVETVNEIFGCNWHSTTPRPDRNYECVPTEAAEFLIGLDSDGRAAYPSEVYVEMARLIEVPRGEALYVPRPYITKRQFIAQDCDVEEEWYDDEKEQIDRRRFLQKYHGDHEALEDILEMEEKWKSYVPPTATPVAVHLSPHEGGGAVVYIGDPFDEDTRMRSLLARLLTTNFQQQKKFSGVLYRYRSRHDVPVGLYKGHVPN